MVPGMGERKLIILSCGSSGTRFISKYMQRGGVYIGHERPMRDGIVSWDLAPGFRERTYYPEAFEFRYIRRIYGRKIYFVHQVRNPVDTISSWLTSKKNIWIFINRVLNLDKYDHPLRRCMIYWIKWNLFAEERSVYTYRVENIKNELKNILYLIKRPEILDRQKEMELQDKHENSKKTLRPYKKYFIDDFYKVDKVLTKIIVKLALKYGYKKEDL